MSGKQQLEWVETGHEVEKVPRAETGFSAAQREWIDRLIADKIATVTSKGSSSKCHSCRDPN